MAEAPEDGSNQGAAKFDPMDAPRRQVTRVLVGTPIHVGGDKPWMCAVKLMGRRRGNEAVEEEFTQTLLLRTGRGVSPEEAQKAALAQLTHVYGQPEDPLPQPIILQKRSDPPPPSPAPPLRRGLLGWLAGLFKTSA